MRPLPPPPRAISVGRSTTAEQPFGKPSSSVAQSSGYSIEKASSNIGRTTGNAARNICCSSDQVANRVESNWTAEAVTATTTATFQDMSQYELIRDVL
jgi:hypothetical protein